MRILTTVAAVTLTLALAAPVAAGPPEDGSGVGTVTHRVIVDSRDADGNVIQDRINGGVLGGTFDGDFEQFLRGVIHKDGMVTFHGTMVFTGVVGDCGVGTITLELEGKGVAGAPITEGRMRTIDQGTDTVKVHVIGTFSQVGATFTYAGQFDCD